MAALLKNGWCRPTRDDETTSGEPPAVGLVEALVNAPARGAVARQALPATARTWTGAVARAATRKILTFYPSTSDAMTAFSRQKCHETRAAIKPSLPFLEWLASSSSPGWQLRGDLDLGDEELGAILGETLQKRLRVTSTSLWSGSGGSRTPLHRDDVSALVSESVWKSNVARPTSLVDGPTGSSAWVVSASSWSRRGTSRTLSRTASSRRTC